MLQGWSWFSNYIVPTKDKTSISLIVKEPSDLWYRWYCGGLFISPELCLLEDIIQYKAPNDI